MKYLLIKNCIDFDYEDAEKVDVDTQVIGTYESEDKVLEATKKELDRYIKSAVGHRLDVDLDNLDDLDEDEKEDLKQEVEDYKSEYKLKIKDKLSTNKSQIVGKLWYDGGAWVEKEFLMAIAID